MVATSSTLSSFTAVFTLTPWGEIISHFDVGSEFGRRFILLSHLSLLSLSLSTWILPSLDPLQVAVDGLAQADGEYDGDHLDGRQQNEKDQDGVEVRLRPREHAVVATLRKRLKCQMIPNSNVKCDTNVTNLEEVRVVRRRGRQAVNVGGLECRRILFRVCNARQGKIRDFDSIQVACCF